MDNNSRIMKELKELQEASRTVSPRLVRSIGLSKPGLFVSAFSSVSLLLSLKVKYFQVLIIWFAPKSDPFWEELQPNFEEKRLWQLARDRVTVVLRESAICRFTHTLKHMVLTLTNSLFTFLRIGRLNEDCVGKPGRWWLKALERNHLWARKYPCDSPLTKCSIFNEVRPCSHARSLSALSHTFFRLLI